MKNLLLVCLIAAAGCGADEPTKEAAAPAASEYPLAVDRLPPCDTDGKLVYLRGEGFRVCQAGTWEAIDLRGADGATVKGKDGESVKGKDGSAGPAGPAGPKGQDGAQGPAGADGRNGVDGVNGADGLAGAAGVDGVNGTNGVDGTNGTNGVDGVNGTNGVDGIDGRSHAYDWTDPVTGRRWLIAGWVAPQYTANGCGTVASDYAFPLVAEVQEALTNGLADAGGPDDAWAIAPNLSRDFFVTFDGVSHAADASPHGFYCVKKP